MSGTTSPPRITILGAGIQGVCAALALDAAGYRVTVVERTPACLTQASRVNEGKIHLGLVYAKDQSLKTAEIMLKSALRFAPLMESMLGHPVRWERFTSRPFSYLVLEDSLVPRERLLVAYEAIQRMYERERTNPELHYLGLRPDRIFDCRTHASLNAQLRPNVVDGVISTVERSIYMPLFRELVRKSFDARSSIVKHYGVEVESASRRNSGFIVKGKTRDGKSWQKESDLVVNCLWGDRLRVDSTLGLSPSHKRWVYRLKYRLHGKLPASLGGLPSLTLVLGRFGDIVVTPGQDSYFSWYPSCLRGWSTDLAPPESWTSETFQRETASDALKQEILNGFASIIPEIARTEAADLAAGIIFSWGNTDIDDPESELHHRDAIGIEAHDGYFSINTGKFTCAPYFADQLVGHLAGTPACP